MSVSVCVCVCVCVRENVCVSVFHPATREERSELWEMSGNLVRMECQGYRGYRGILPVTPPSSPPFPPLRMWFTASQFNIWISAVQPKHVERERETKSKTRAVSVSELVNRNILRWLRCISYTPAQIIYLLTFEVKTSKHKPCSKRTSKIILSRVLLFSILCTCEREIAVCELFLVPDFLQITFSSEIYPQTLRDVPVRGTVWGLFPRKALAFVSIVVDFEFSFGSSPRCSSQPLFIFTGEQDSCIQDLRILSGSYSSFAPGCYTTQDKAIYCLCGMTWCI